jgi:hypothetical protein
METVGAPAATDDLAAAATDGDGGPRGPNRLGDHVQLAMGRADLGVLPANR